MHEDVFPHNLCVLRVRPALELISILCCQNKYIEAHI